MVLYATGEPPEVLVNAGAVLLVIPVAGGDDTVAIRWRSTDAFELALEEIGRQFPLARDAYSKARDATLFRSAS